MDITWAQFAPAFLLTLFAGLSTGFGALLAFFSKAKDHTFLSIGMGFSAGVMVYVSFVEILEKSKTAFIAIYTSPILGESLALICFFGGIGFSALIDKFIPEDVNPHEPKSDKELSVLKEGNKHSLLQNSALKRTGIFTALAIGIHNFPEGFATFISALDDLSLGVSIALAIAIHNIPEGIAIAVPVYAATKSKSMALLASFISGLAEPLGALIGYSILAPFMNPVVFGTVFGLIAGVMVFLALDELLPAAKRYSKGHETVYGLVTGMSMLAISLVLFKFM